MAILEADRKHIYKEIKYNLPSLENFGAVIFLSTFPDKPISDCFFYKTMYN